MQKLVLKLLVCACIGSLCSCAQPAQPEEETLYVSILPLKSIVGGIVGDDFDVRVLVPAGASPETFEPTPRQFVDLNRARLIFNVGLIDFETTLLGKIEARDKVVDLSRGIDLIAGSCSHAHNKVARAHELHAAATPEEQQTAGSHAAAMPRERQLAGRHAATPAPQAHGHSHAHGIDPHIWASPRALQRMAANAYEAIHALWPDSVKYTENHARLQEQLAALDARTAGKIAASGVRYFIIYHPALTYYARDYGLQQVAIEDDGKEPSARALARLIEQARRDSVRTIFYQSQFPASAVEVIARDIEAQSVAIDPLKEDVIANIDSLTDLIVAQ
ncbi:metal ABC transporter solute-binding protein, Zn/Mn family [uncultured Alistipes sp.]|uniref:metal ABC transporter solute-binding protein, Zn/Mn family n=1 Tax=uncultured Alistipes sp. TaxID=538949 RepID=UPI002805B31D|nr:zinc ABC transporter substrate-binding protein [uncultured Alistipes sp.]